MPRDGVGLGESFTFYGDHIEWAGAMAARVLLGVERATGFSFDVISGRGRLKKRAAVRKAAIWLLREVADLTFVAIARLFDRNHSTVINAHRRALWDYDSRWVIEAVLARRQDFEVIESAHGGVKVF
jgi:hypothetical protein